MDLSIHLSDLLVPPQSHVLVHGQPTGCNAVCRFRQPGSPVGDCTPHLEQEGPEHRQHLVITPNHEGDGTWATKKHMLTEHCHNTT